MLHFDVVSAQNLLTEWGKAMQTIDTIAQLTLTTPAMMFPAISLLLLAYTNRYLTLSDRIRSLFENYRSQPDKLVLLQIDSLRARLKLIRLMQVSGVTSLLLSVSVMFFLYIGLTTLAHIIFGIALLLMMFSLILSVQELHVSNEALNILLSDIETHQTPQSTTASTKGK